MLYFILICTVYAHTKNKTAVVIATWVYSDMFIGFSVSGRRQASCAVCHTDPLAQ